MSDTTAPEVAPDAEAPSIPAIPAVSTAKPRPPSARAAARKPAARKAAAAAPEPREAKVDKSYIERPYSEAMTSEQKAALEAAGLLQ